MADTFDLEMVSPERLLLSRPVEMATIPATEGEMGVLPGHAPMIVTLRGGVLRVRENGAETERLFVMGGFAEITPSRVTVLAEEATPVADLSRAGAERRLAEAEAALAGMDASSPAATELAMARVAAAREMVGAAQAA